MDRTLADTYLNTRYFVDVPGGRVCIRIGQASPELEALLAREGAFCWAFITAWNPRSTPTTLAENQAAQSRLLADLDHAGYRCFPGEGVGESGDWPPEASVLALGISRGQAADLAHRYGQNALVVGTRGGPAELVWTQTAAPPSTLHEP